MTETLMKVIADVIAHPDFKYYFVGLMRGCGKTITAQLIANAIGIKGEITMDIKSFVNLIDHQCAFGTYIVTLKYKYDHEEKYTIENQVVSVDPDYVTWFDDWCEGQKDVEIIGFMPLENIETIIIKKDIKSFNIKEYIDHENNKS